MPLRTNPNTFPLSVSTMFCLAEAETVAPGIAEGFAAAMDAGARTDAAVPPARAAALCIIARRLNFLADKFSGAAFLSFIWRLLQSG
jgi:hypothetical protein